MASWQCWCWSCCINQNYLWRYFSPALVFIFNHFLKSFCFYTLSVYVNKPASYKIKLLTAMGHHGLAMVKSKYIYWEAYTSVSMCVCVYSRMILFVGGPFLVLLHIFTDCSRKLHIIFPTDISMWKDIFSLHHRFSSCFFKKN